MAIWVVYILQCRDETLYTGITNNLQKRVDEHNGDKLGAKYTKARQPVKLVYQENVTSRSAALKREHAIRKLSRAEKIALLQLSHRVISESGL